MFFLRLASLIQHIFEIHLSLCVYQYFIPFYFWVVFHCVDLAQCIYPFTHWKTFVWFPGLGYKKSNFCECAANQRKFLNFSLRVKQEVFCLLPLITAWIKRSPVPVFSTKVLQQTSKIPSKVSKIRLYHLH